MHPICASRSTAFDPTLPKPWTTTRASSTGAPRFFSVASVT